MVLEITVGHWQTPITTCHSTTSTTPHRQNKLAFTSMPSPNCAIERNEKTWEYWSDASFEPCSAKSMPPLNHIVQKKKTPLNHALQKACLLWTKLCKKHDSFEPCSAKSMPPLNHVVRKTRLLWTTLLKSIPRLNHTLQYQCVILFIPLKPQSKVKQTFQRAADNVLHSAKQSVKESNKHFWSCYLSPLYISMSSKTQGLTRKFLNLLLILSMYGIWSKSATLLSMSGECVAGVLKHTNQNEWRVPHIQIIYEISLKSFPLLHPPNIELLQAFEAGLLLSIIVVLELQLSIIVELVIYITMVTPKKDHVQMT